MWEVEKLHFFPIFVVLNSFFFLIILNNNKFNIFFEIMKRHVFFLVCVYCICLFCVRMGEVVCRILEKLRLDFCRFGVLVCENNFVNNLVVCAHDEDELNFIYFLEISNLNISKIRRRQNIIIIIHNTHSRSYLLEILVYIENGYLVVCLP